MRVVKGFYDLGVGLPASAVTIGNFDGVHRGHQRVMKAAVTAGRDAGIPAVVCTFEPHTLKILRPDRAPSLLQTLEQRLAAIEQLGVDVVVVIPFDDEVAATGRRRFVDEFLCDELRVQSLHVSRGFSFGRGRGGRTEYLEERAAEKQFTVVRVDAAQETGDTVSSSRIRAAVTEGRVADAAAMLGRPYSLSGTVIHGSGRGAQLGAPTANIAPLNECLPGPGVYVGQLQGPDLDASAVMNVGVRPTFTSTDELSFEAHLLDFDGDLYEAEVELRFIDRLRDERRFESPDALSEQIQADAKMARRTLEATASR
ncbi:MAG: bifunctional riboflavin kinase/FAD synthetase [Acidobacteria bacterium]|nr:bifunctional riboflavin kinase/FAD synthetase [Acidobacteriota bacterium]